MNRRDAALTAQIQARLDEFARNRAPMPGIRKPAARDVFVRQLVESVHRIRYILVICGRRLASERSNPEDSLFDPLKAAILAYRRGELDEAFWLVFLFVHFGKHRRAGWRYAREIYGRLDGGARWDWANTSADPAAFRTWLNANRASLTRDGVARGFGNHRKYQSLDAYSASGTGAVVESYVNWVKPPRTHAELMDQAIAASRHPRPAFRMLYDSMDAVVGFGRTAIFDYLAMVGKVGLARIEPDSTHLRGSTGPLAGARLMFENAVQMSIGELEALADALADHLGIGMQVIEDALCNWQKSPTDFSPFRG